MTSAGPIRLGQGTWDDTGGRKGFSSDRGGGIGLKTFINTEEHGDCASSEREGKKSLTRARRNIIVNK